MKFVPCNLEFPYTFWESPDPIKRGKKICSRFVCHMTCLNLLLTINASRLTHLLHSKIGELVPPKNSSRARCSRSHRVRTPGRRFNIKKFGSKNHLSFGLRFPTLRKCSKMGSLYMSRNKNGISIPFSRRNSSQHFVY